MERSVETIGGAPVTIEQDIRPLTGLRGVAALYVVLVHYFGGTSLTNPITTFIIHGYLAVDLFFVLSGFVMALNYAPMFETGWSSASYIRFLGRRIARIYPLYLMGVLIGGGLIAAGLADVPRSMFTTMNVVQNILMVQSWFFILSFDPPAWSISDEWAAYLLFPILVNAFLFHRTFWTWLSGFVSLALLILLATLPQPWSDGGGQLLNVFHKGLSLPLRCLPEFTLGLLAFRLAGTRFGLKLRSTAWLPSVLCCVLVALLVVPKTDVLIVVLCPLLVLALTTRGLSASARVLGSRPLEFMGRLSYSIYLIHDLFQPLVGWIHSLAAAHGLQHAQTYGAIAGILLTIPCSYLAYRLIEMPGRRWLRKIFEGARPGPMVVEPSAP